MRPIDADALLNDPIFRTVRRVDEFDEIGESVSYLAVPVEYIEKAPTLEYAPVVHGEWIHDINNLYACSECLMRQTQRMRGRLMNFCPNCGASMMDGGKAMVEWISVKDRLPNADGEYLVFQHGYSGYKFVRTASFNVCYSGIDDDMHGKTVWYDYDSECGDYELIGITHWMPLPKAPKEEEE